MTTITDNINEFLTTHGVELLHALSARTQALYETFEYALEQEFYIPASEAQINQALDKFVTKKVNAILDLHLQLHDGWLRLYATVNYKGIFAKLAVNLALVHVQLDQQRQRFVFSQLSDTEVISLYTDSYLKSKALFSAVWFFHNVLKKDPLGLILGKINLARQKEEVLYLDIGRWLKRNEKIMSTLKKVQINHGLLLEEQLVLKANANITEVLNIGPDKLVITEDDNPNKLPETETVLKKQAKGQSQSSEVLVAAKPTKNEAA